MELKATSIQTIRVHLNLVEVVAADSKAKKVDPKKAKEVVPEIVTEVFQDEEGRTLPRICFADDNSLNEYYKPLKFRRTFSPEQVERRVFQDTLKASIAEASADQSGDTDENITDKADLQRRYDESIAERGDVYLEQPCGPELDHCMCAAFRIITEFAQKKQLSTVKSKNQGRLLWNSIYPQLPSGRPIYNSSGKYAVKLFLAGKWRKILVTDAMPLNSNGVVLASSEEPLELWPIILSKAVYAVYTACG